MLCRVVIVAEMCGRVPVVGFPVIHILTDVCDFFIFGVIPPYPGLITICLK